MLTGRRKCAVVLLAWVAGCGGTDGAVVVPTPPKAQTATLDVTVVTSGGDPDVNGYEIVVDTMRRQVAGGVTAGGVLTTIAPLSGLPAGTYTVTLSGVAANCSVNESQPQHVALVGGQRTAISFTVTCEATGVSVNVRTTGTDSPPNYDILVDGHAVSAVTPNGATTVSRLAPGPHVIGIGVRTTNCEASVVSQITVNVTSRNVSTVKFDVTCTPAQRHAKIAYVVDTIVGGVQASWVMVADADGSGSVPVAMGSDPAWSPDGKTLAYSSVKCGPFDAYYGYICPGGVTLVDPERWLTTQLANGVGGSMPMWAPAGDALLFTRCCQFTDRNRVLILNPTVPTAPATPVTIDGASLVSDGAWSPDGQRIAFACIVGNSRNVDLCSANRDGTGLVQLTNDAAIDQSPVWSPDGTRIAFSHLPIGSSGSLEVMVVGVDGKGLSKVVTGYDPAWMPDGVTLLFSDGTGLHTIAADGTKRARLTTGAQRAPAWRP